MVTRCLRSALAAALLLLNAGGLVFGHAALINATPGPSDIIGAVPAELVATFSQNLDQNRSSIELRDATGTQLAIGGRDPAAERVLRLTLPPLAPGTYTVRWTSFSTEDGELARGTYVFSVAPSPSPSPAGTSAPSVRSPSTAPTEAAVTPAPPVGSRSTSQSSGPGPGTAGGLDVLVPIVGAALAGAVVAAWALRRRGR